jgi:hypothetical protein
MRTPAMAPHRQRAVEAPAGAWPDERDHSVGAAVIFRRNREIRRRHNK